MDSPAIRSVAIVGGGVAGGMSALFLRKFLGGKVDIQVLAPSSMPPMTIGESTNGPFTGFLDSLGLTRQTLIRECDATIKVASEFDNWSPAGKGEKWTHEFQSNTTHAGIPLFHFWLQRFRQGQTVTKYQDACFVNAQLIRECRVPFATADAAPAFSYGYHINGTKLGQLLHARCIDLGVRWDDEEVVSAQLDSKGQIESLACRSGREVAADFFIDCTGFRRKLMSLALGDSPDALRWESFTEYLHCDSAVFFTLPPDSSRVRPSTLGTALSSGWVWDIPLRDRISLGYVYSSKHSDKCSAEQEFRAFVGRGNNQPVGHLHWNPGMLDRAWVGNCLALGVSNSFAEPIESLTSATLTVELRQLLRNFPNRNFNHAGRERYNNVVRRQCLNNRDFISLHYATGGRDDTPFWRAIQHDTRRSERVQALLADYRSQAPHTLDGIYDVKAIFGMFTARGIVPRDDLPLLNYLDQEGAEERFLAIAQDHAELRDRYMDHTDYLNGIELTPIAA